MIAQTCGCGGVMVPQFTEPDRIPTTSSSYVNDAKIEGWICVECGSLLQAEGGHCSYLDGLKLLSEVLTKMKK